MRADENVLLRNGNSNGPTNRQALTSSSYSSAVSGAEKDDLEDQGSRDNGGHALPIVALIALLGLFLSSAAGIVFFALGGLQFMIERSSELPSRIVVLVASVVGVTYFPIHLCAARTAYRKRDHGAPQMYGNYLAAAGLLLARLEVPIWITAIVTTSLAVARIRLDISRPFGIESSQTIYVNLLLSVTGLLSNAALLCCVEWSVTPFATALVSKSAFLLDRGLSPEPAVLLPPTSPEPQDRHRSLNNSDRATGAWPAQMQAAGVGAYSTNIRASRVAPKNPTAAIPAFPPGTAISELSVGVPPLPPGPDGRSPVHMAWRPPSHYGKRSMDESRRRHSRATSIASASGVRSVPYAEREPRLPDVLTMPQLPRRPVTSYSSPSSPTGAAGSRAMGGPGAEHPHQKGPLAPAAEVSAQRRRRHTMVGHGRPSGSFGGAVLADQRTTPMPTLPVTPRPTTSPSSTATGGPPGAKPPSPRARSLRSHPPFAAPLTQSGLPRKISPPPQPPVLSRPAGTPPAGRPRTAPGVASAPTHDWGGQARKPLGKGLASGQSAKDETSDDSDEDFDDEDSDDEDDDDDAFYSAEDEATGRGPAMSRTARRIQKEKLRKEIGLRRAQAVNQNFSRPLQRSKSMGNLHNGRSVSVYDDSRSGFAMINGSLRP